MDHARQAETAGNTGYSEIIDELGLAGQKRWQMNEDPWYSQCDQDVNLFYQDPGECWVTCDRQRRYWRNFIGLAVYHGLSSYVEKKAKADILLVVGQDETPLLLYTLIPKSGQLRPWFAEMAALLLKLGANPNQLWFGNSPWQQALTQLHQQDHFDYQGGARFLISMLSYGASPFTTCTRNHRTSGSSCLRYSSMFGQYTQHAHSVHAVINHLLKFYLDSEAAEIERLLRHLIKLHESCQDLDGSDIAGYERNRKRQSDEPLSHDPRKRWRQNSDRAAFGHRVEYGR